MEFVVAQQPGFAEPLAGGAGDIHPTLKATAAPGHRPEKWLKDERIERHVGHHHWASSPNGWIGPVPLGFGRDFRIASARLTSSLVVILIFVGEPCTRWTACPAASRSWPSSVMSLPSFSRFK